MVKLDIAIAFTFLAHLSIGIKAIQLFGTGEQKRKYLVQAASGEMIFAYALTEPRIGSDAQHIETAALVGRDNAHYVLNGRKTYITNANYAGGMTVFAQLDPNRPGFMGAFIVETGWEGVRVGKEMPKMGLRTSFHRLHPVQKRAHTQREPHRQTWRGLQGGHVSAELRQAGPGGRFSLPDEHLGQGHV